MNAPIRVLVADDHPLFRAGVRTLLERATGVEVVGEAGTGAEALALVHRLRPDVLLLDMEMPEMDGVEVARRLRATGASVRVLVLSAYDDHQYVAELLALGTAGYLTKEEVPERIVAAVRGVMSGQGGWFSPSVTERNTQRERALHHRSSEHAATSLSAREREVLRLIASGLDNPSIAQRLFISDNTVKNHITNIYGKLGVRTRAEAVAWAWRNGVVVPDAPSP